MRLAFMFRQTDRAGELHVTLHESRPHTPPSLPLRFRFLAPLPHLVLHRRGASQKIVNDESTWRLRGIEQPEELALRSLVHAADVELRTQSEAETADQVVARASHWATGALAKVPPEVMDQILAQDLHVADHLAISWTCSFFRKIYEQDTLIALAPAEYQKFRSPEEKIADARRRTTIVTSYVKSLDADPNTADRPGRPHRCDATSSDAPQAIEDSAVDAAHAHIPYGIMRRRMEDSVAAWLETTVGKESDFGHCPAFSVSASLDQTRAWLISTVATRHMSKMQAMERFQLSQKDLNRLPTVVARRLDMGNGLVRSPRNGLVRLYYEETIRSFVIRQYHAASLEEREALVQEKQAAAKARKRSFGELVSVCPQEVANSPILKFKKRRIDAPVGELQHN